MSEPYTPTPDIARNLYAVGRDEADGMIEPLRSFDEFDRLIQQVKAEALREAVIEFEGNVGIEEFDEQSARPGRGGLTHWAFIDQAWNNQGAFMDWLRNRADRIEEEPDHGAA